MFMHAGLVMHMHVILAAGWQDYEHIYIASGGFSPVKSLDTVPSIPSCLPASASSALRTTRSMKGKMQNAVIALPWEYDLSSEFVIDWLRIGEW